MLRWILASLSLVVAAVAVGGPARTATAFPTPPPLPSPSPVTENFFGTNVSDPYRYFEDMSNPVVVDFFKNQNAYTRSVLDMLGAPRQRLFQRIKQLDNVVASVSSVQTAGSKYFYEKLNPGESTPKLYVRDASGGPEKVLVDTAALATTGKHYSINYYTPSIDGGKVAYGISEGGSEASVIHVVDTATGQTLPDAISRAYFVGVTAWRPDGKSFYYVRFPELKPGEPDVDKETRAVNYLHVLGRDPGQDVPIFGYGVNPSVPFEKTDFPVIVYSPASKHVLAVVVHGVKNEQTIYSAAALSSLPENSNIAWTKIVSDDDDVVSVDLKGSTLYMLTHQGAPTYKVLAMSLESPNVAGATTVVPASRSILLQISVAGDGLYVRSRTGGFAKIDRFALAADGTPGVRSAVHLPFAGAVNVMATDPLVPGALFGLTGWLHSLLYYHVDAAGEVANTGIKPRANIDVSAYTSQEVQARSADGTMVPMSIIYRKNLKLDGSHPVNLEGYGAYGITEDPGFSATAFAWLERGGVDATCHSRGGGWYGDAWHTAGMIATKNHTWEDFVACGEWLVRHKFTSKAHLGGQGTSAGGISIGRAITSRPDLFAAALDVVGVSNAMRSEFSPNGPPNIPEFGTVTNGAGFKALYAMDAYQHVVDGTAYPGVLLITGYNDPRVSSWELAKFTARLQQASTSGRPILLRVDYDAGHGFMASSRSQSEQLLTDEYSFLLWQLGDPAFAGIPKKIVPAKMAQGQ
jgi:prolyl oligopeptidase